MLKHSSYLTKDHQRILYHIQPQLAKDGMPGYDGLMIYYLPNYPDLVAMTGKQVRRHTDGIQAWQPLLVLVNPGWTFKGPNQSTGSLMPQPPGNLLVLDIGQRHQVTAGRSWNKKPGRWTVLCWNPGRVPPAKAEYSVEDVVNRSREAFLGLLEEVKAA